MHPLQVIAASMVVQAMRDQFSRSSAGPMPSDADGVIRHERLATIPINSYRYAEVVQAPRALRPGLPAPTAA